MKAYTKEPLVVKVFAHTIGADHDYHVCTDREECIATCWGQDDVAKDNANLFASAPELLEALNAFPMLLAPATSAWGKEVQEWQYKASAAIAKAEGK